MSKSYPSETHVAGHETFFWPLWDKPGIEQIFRKHEYDYSNNLAIHTWNSLAAREGELVGLSQSWLLQSTGPRYYR